MMDNELLNFIKKARNKGYSDLQIRKVLIEHNWPIETIEEVFSFLNPKFKLKNQICIFLSSELIAKLEKRAKKNLFTLSEQIEDILRRSCINTKSTSQQEKLDDTIISLFSRKRK